MNDFDDTIVVLCDGAISVEGVMVSASRSFRRDPRLAQPTDAMIHALYLRDVFTARWRAPEPGKLWCSECDCWKYEDQYASDPRTHSGKSYICRDCKKDADARRYRARVGREVADYHDRRMA